MREYSYMKRKRVSNARWDKWKVESMRYNESTTGCDHPWWKDKWKDEHESEGWRCWYKDVTRDEKPSIRPETFKNYYSGVMSKAE